MPGPNSPSGPLSFLGDLLSLLRDDISGQEFLTLRDVVEGWEETQRHQIWDEFTTHLAGQPPPQNGTTQHAFAQDPGGTVVGLQSLIADDPESYMEGLQKLVAADMGLLRLDFIRKPVVAIFDDPLLKMRWDTFLKGQKLYPADFWGAVHAMELHGRNTRNETIRTGFEYEVSSGFDPTADPAPEWLVDGVLPRGGFSVLGAKPKVGKTTFGFSLGWAVARGVSFLGRSTTQGRVLHFALEGVRQHDVLTMYEMGGHEKHFVRFGQQLPASQYDVLAQTITEHKLDLVIIDTIFKFAKIADMNDYGQVTNAFARLIELCQTTGCHIMAVHHLRKSKGDDVGDQILGSTAIYGSVDTYIDYQWQGEEDATADRVLFTRQRYGLGMPKTLIGLDVETGRIVARGTPQESRRHTLSQAVLDALPPSGTPVAKQAIVEKIDARRQDVYAAVNTLIELGLVGQEKYSKTQMIWAIEATPGTA